MKQIKAWMRAYRSQTGKWPGAWSEPTGLPEGETWRLIDQSLREGERGLPGGSSLSRLSRGMKG